MKETLMRSEAATLRSEPSIQFFSENEVFLCPEESQFYAHCLELMVLNRCLSSDLIVEFGAGDGCPVISALLRSKFNSVIHGYELNRSACRLAQAKIEQYHLEHQYVVHHASFFDAADPEAEYLIANPPYLPAPDDKICLPLLHGGTDGAAITNRLLSLNYNNAMLMVSSYSNPVGTIEHAIAQGYAVADFMVLPLRFGYYSSEPKVENSISSLKQSSKAFYSSNIYFLAGVLFQKNHRAGVDLSTELIKVMTSL